MASFGVDEDRVLRALLTRGNQTVQELAEQCGITATAVRHHLQGLMARGMVARREERSGQRGRPKFVYYVPPEVQAELASNFADLAVAIWQELDACEDRSFATRLLRAAGDRLGRFYAAVVGQGPLATRLKRLADLLRRRGVMAETVETENGLALRLLTCPYQRLAEGDRKVCGIEKRVFTEALGTRVLLQQCRLDGHECCEFRAAEASQVA